MNATLWLLLKDGWFQVWLALAASSAVAAGYSHLAAPPLTAAPPAAASAAPAAPAAKPPAPVLQGAGVTAILKKKRADRWLVDELPSPDRDTGSVAEAIQNALSGDLIVLRPGRYPAAITTDKSLTFRGETQPGSRKRAVLYNHGSTVLWMPGGWCRMESLDVEQTALTNAQGNSAPAIMLGGGRLALVDVRIQSVGQGGIYQDEGALDILSSSFTTNGVGVLTNKGTLTCERCTFLRNRAFGLAIGENSGGVRVTRSSFIENGVGVNAYSRVVIEDSVFKDNTSGIENNGDEVTLRRVQILRSIKKGIGAYGGETRVEDSSILDGGGLGLYLTDDAIVSLKRSVVRGNRPGLLAFKKSVLMTEGSTIKGNHDGDYDFNDAARGIGDIVWPRKSR